MDVGVAIGVGVRGFFAASAGVAAPGESTKMASTMQSRAIADPNLILSNSISEISLRQQTYRLAARILSMKRHPLDVPKTTCQRGWRIHIHLITHWLCRPQFAGLEQVDLG
jgi:hypothetical protein